jgi:hypothetical protein
MIMVCTVSFTNCIETLFERYDYELRVNQKVINRFEPQQKRDPESAPFSEGVLASH